MGKKLNAKEFIIKAKQLHSDKYDYSKVNYVNSRTKVQIICLKHGVFEQRPSNHLNGNGCPKCAREWSDIHKIHHAESSRKSRGMTTDEWIARAKKVHGNKYDYSQTIYVNQRTNVKIICPVHGLFIQKADSHIRGYGCRLCGLASENRKGCHNWSDKQRRKVTTTCLERYGTVRYLDSQQGKDKIAKVKSSTEFRNKMRDIISSSDVQEKTKTTVLSRYGVTSVMKLPEIVTKNEETKRRNKTWRTSKSEEKMYNLLCERFGKNDVKRQYKECRYPFRCDFYIVSLDLFIELNATWLHGQHWFDNLDENDRLKLIEWKSKAVDGHEFYNVAIDVWTVRDVKKKQTAIENNINYVVFWKNDLSDFTKWIKSDELQLKMY